ncbi:MAG: hypothetical protein JXA69_14685 [Phycisphaerae bacterium]|nr:hypothetical protein [Phycisphaerae bacterium]
MATKSETTKRFAGGTRVPATACVFTCRGEAVTFADSDDEQKKFAIEAYDGGIIANHWYWGNLAFDLGGLKFAGRRTPVLDTHDTSLRVGFSTKQTIDDEGVHFEGKYLSNPKAQELRSDMKEGYPMQASLSLEPTTKPEFVEDGQSAEVNGRTLKGPGAIFRNARIREVSMCSFGAAPNTRSTALAGGDETFEFSIDERKDDIMANEKKSEAVTLESFKADYPEIYGQAVAAGTTAERQRFAELREACGDDGELLATAFADGHDVTWALKQRNQRLATELAEAKKTPPLPPNGDDAARQEFVEQPAPKGQDDAAANRPTTFMAAVEAYQTEHTCTTSEAVDKCVDLYPDLHEAMKGGA